MNTECSIAFECQLQPRQRGKRPKARSPTGEAVLRPLGLSDDAGSSVPLLAGAVKSDLAIDNNRHEFIALSVLELNDLMTAASQLCPSARRLRILLYSLVLVAVDTECDGPQTLTTCAAYRCRLAFHGNRTGGHRLRGDRLQDLCVNHWLMLRKLGVTNCRQINLPCLVRESIQQMQCERFGIQEHLPLLESNLPFLWIACFHELFCGVTGKHHGKVFRSLPGNAEHTGKYIVRDFNCVPLNLWIVLELCHRHVQSWQYDLLECQPGAFRLIHSNLGIGSVVVACNLQNSVGTQVGDAEGVL